MPGMGTQTRNCHCYERSTSSGGHRAVFRGNWVILLPWAPPLENSKLRDRLSWGATVVTYPLIAVSAASVFFGQPGASRPLSRTGVVAAPSLVAGSGSSSPRRS
jgi:hypothetical protein